MIYDHKVDKITHFDVATEVHSSPPPSYPVPARVRQPEPPITFNTTEDGAAQRLANLKFPDQLLFDELSGQWHVFDSKRWRQVHPREIEHFVVKLAEAYREDSNGQHCDTIKKELIKFARSLEAQRTIQNIVNAAQRYCQFDGERFNIDPMAFNVMNGTVHLSEASCLKHHNSKDLISKVANVEYDLGAECPKFEAFVYQMMGGDVEVIGFLQEALGTALMGQNPDRIVVALLGEGRNGKSVLLKVIRHIFGDYGQDAPPDLMLQKSGGGASPELARMIGIRIVCLDDPDIGNNQKTAVDNLKRLSGDQKIVGRALYGSYIEFRGVMTPLIAWNKVPDLHGGGGEAIWDRLAMFDIKHRISDSAKNPNLENELLEEAPGILNWLIVGFEHRMKRGHLEWPNAILDTKEQLRNQPDSAGQFVTYFVAKQKGKRIKVTDLYQAYETWCVANGRDLYDKSRFKHCMERAGYAQYKTKGLMHWRDTVLQHPDP